MAIVGHVMQIVGFHERDNDVLRRIADELFAAFHDAGGEIITDHDRAEAGLEPRNADGLTRSELCAIEARLLQVQLAPFSPFLFKDAEPADHGETRRQSESTGKAKEPGR